MSQEAKPGDVCLVYNTKNGSHPVGLTKEQHWILQAFVAQLTKDAPMQVIKEVIIDYKINEPKS